MWRAIELSNVHDIVLVLEDSCLVVVDIEVIWCGEDGHDRRESSSSRLSVHAVSGILGLVSTDDRKEVVFLEEVAGGWVGEEVGTAANVVVDKVFGSLFLTEFFQWVGPEDVAHESLSWWLTETVDLGFVSICWI